MSSQDRDKVVRRLSEAEGYLMLDLPAQALEILQSRSEWSSMQFEASLLTGESLRQLGRYREALTPLERAASLRPTDPNLAMALGWCYKRTHRLAQAIDALERALKQHPGESLLHFNLACYWSLAGQPQSAIAALGRALRCDETLRERLAAEPDLESLRAFPEFQRLLDSPPAHAS